MRPVGADRLALALLGAKPADEAGPISRPIISAVAVAAAGAEADVADEVEDAGEAQLLGDQDRAWPPPPAIRSTSFASPIELDALTSTASPGRTRRASSRVARLDIVGAVDAHLAVQRILQRPHILADQDQLVDLCVAHAGASPA